MGVSTEANDAEKTTNARSPHTSLSYTGLLQLETHGEADDVLFVSGEEEPLAEVLQDSISDKIVTVRYWITEEECSREIAQEQFMKRLVGSADCEFASWYSDITGYLWTDEEIKIGGHDLLAELQSHIGKWLILEVEVF